VCASSLYSGEGKNPLTCDFFTAGGERTSHLGFLFPKRAGAADAVVSRGPFLDEGNSPSSAGRFNQNYQPGREREKMKPLSCLVGRSLE
jgi:hypothetical protein